MELCRNTSPFAFGQISSGRSPYSQSMERAIAIIAVDADGADGILVTFSDGTVAGYVVEELLALRPQREFSRARRCRPLQLETRPLSR